MVSLQFCKVVLFLIFIKIVLYTVSDKRVRGWRAEQNCKFRGNRVFGGVIARIACLPVDCVLRNAALVVIGCTG